EKDRTGVLAGKVIKNPSFSTVEPLLPLLGETQAPIEDEDERIAKDGELMDKQDEKDKKRGEKSLALFREFQPRVLTCGDLGSLGEIAAELKKQNRYLMEEHANALREMYRSRREKLVNEAAPDAA